MERLITILLEDLNIDAELANDYHGYNLKSNISNERIKDLFFLDSLKLSFKKNTDQALLNLYLEKRHAYLCNNHLY